MNWTPLFKPGLFTNCSDIKFKMTDENGKNKIDSDAFFTIKMVFTCI